jgi:hypothetical protein
MAQLIRAQYLINLALGEAAERYAINRLRLPIQKLRRENPKFASHPELLVKASLLDDFAKIRIYPGPWIRRPRKKDRQLLVPEWVRVWQASGAPRLTAEQRNARKLARWGALLPERESRLQIKGGWVHKDTGASLGRRARDKENRSFEMQSYGFSRKVNSLLEDCAVGQH